MQKATLYANLTNRECEILQLLAQGVSNETIAIRLLIGIGTVKNHVHNVLKKLRLRSRRDAIAYHSFVQQRATVTQLAYA